jgi:hypothetical protein
VPPPPGAHLLLDFSSASCALVGNLALETFAMSENSGWEACSNNMRVQRYWPCYRQRGSISGSSRYSDGR